MANLRTSRARERANGFYKKFSLLRAPVRPFMRAISVELSDGMLGIRSALRRLIKREKEKSEVIK